MCAIAGYISFTGSSLTTEQLALMLHTMKRRGPDEDGIKRYGRADLIHARLAVIDLEHGKQPMTCQTDGGEVTLLYNGELYNTGELRAELEGDGMRFESQSDTEVVLKAYIRWGDGCALRFNGIFAVAIWDEGAGRLFLARDCFGVKPFFYAPLKDGFLFASEIKTILASGLIEPVLDSNGIAELLLLGPGRTPGCGVLRGIYEVKPGHCGYLDAGGLRLEPYWQLRDSAHDEDTPATVKTVRRLVETAIERQLVSDVPIGTFLSGGLDSSIISSVANRYMRERGARLTTFSLTYRDNRKYFKSSHFQPNSDDDFIDTMREYLGCEHIEITLDTPDVADALCEALDARDLPGMADVDSSLLLFCREIKKHVTVALSGECADEVFGGYPWFRDPEVRDGYGFPWARNTEYRASFLKADIAALINAHGFVSARYDEYCRLAPKLPGPGAEDARIREMSYLNMYGFMQTLLERKDRMSMYSGLEVRVPYCDRDIAQYLYSTPWEMKELGGYEKGLLRHAFSDMLPQRILWRKKSPYPKTHNPAYLAAVTSLLRESIADGNAPILEIINRASIETLLSGRDGEPWYGQLMTLPQTIAYFFMINYWLAKYKIKIVP